MMKIKVKIGKSKKTKEKKTNDILHSDVLTKNQKEKKTFR